MSRGDNGEGDRSDSDLDIVDCDIHIGMPSEEFVADHLPPRYAERGVTLPMPGYAHPHGRVMDNDEQEGGTTPEKTADYHLDRHGIDRGIVTASTLLLASSIHPNRDYAGELAALGNAYLDEEWLGHDDRLYGSVLVPPTNVERAVSLVEEYGDRDDFVQVVMGSACEQAYGNPRFWPIYEAAAERDLPVAIHTGNDGAGVSNPVGQGNPSNYFEWHNAFPQTYMSHVNSLIVEGVFEEFPELTFVCIEGGFAWAPHLMWRMDKNWRGLRDQAPWLDEPPSYYFENNVRFTTQPVPEPESPEHLIHLLDMMHAEETLMFASDYPPWDVDDPDFVLPSGVDEALERRVFAGNALDAYDFPA